MRRILRTVSINVLNKYEFSVIKKILLLGLFIFISSNQCNVVLPLKTENSLKLESPYASGFVGLGTWNNSAEFKDYKVTAPDGKVLYKSDFSKNIDDWKKIGKGEWTVHDGELRQSAMETGVIAFVGNTNWTDYTMTFKARKIAGDNGFQIYFRDHSIRDRIRWDLGGYDNSVYMMEMGVTSKSINAGIVPGRWYDIKIVIRGNSVKDYLDGKLIPEVGGERTDAKSLCASAERDDKSSGIILKVVNASADPLETTINLEGAGTLSGIGKAEVLTSKKPTDENSLDDPIKVSPKTEIIKFSGTTITRLFQGNSLTVMRIPAKG